MNRIESRPYLSTNDLESMLDLLVSVRSPDRLADFPGPVDLHEMLAIAAVQANTCLWFDAMGGLAAFALVDAYNNLHFEHRPESVSLEMESQIVAWAIWCVRPPGQITPDPLTLDASCREEDEARIAFFERHGFERQAARSLLLERSLAEPISTPQLPPGFVIRPIGGVHEVEELVVLHRAAFGTDYMTIDERLAMMGVPEYDKNLDLLAVAPGGQIAAYCMCSISLEENRLTGRKEGDTDPIATHPQFQKRGLAKALLLTGLHELRHRGIDTAILGTSSQNTAMLQTAASVGFKTRSARVWFSYVKSPSPTPPQTS